MRVRVCVFKFSFRESSRCRRRYYGNVIAAVERSDTAEVMDLEVASAEIGMLDADVASYVPFDASIAALQSLG